jgi:hypothetical protein
MQSPCPQCQTLNRPEAKFCIKCGSPLMPATPAAPQPPAMTMPSPAAIPTPPPTPVSGASQPRLTRPVFQGPPPPYSPPPYTSPRQEALKGMSHGQMMFLLGFAIVIVATLIVVAGFLLIRQAPLKSTVTPTLVTPTPITTTPTEPTRTPKPTSKPTVTPVAGTTPSANQWATALRGEGLLNVSLRYCSARGFENNSALNRYARQVADMNNIPWPLGEAPKLREGQTLQMPPCP